MFLINFFFDILKLFWMRVFDLDPCYVLDVKANHRLSVFVSTKH